MPFGSQRHGRWPGQCELCRGWSAGLVCPACIQAHARTRARCQRCGLGSGQPLAQCGQCLQDPPPCWRTVCALDYTFPWDRLIGHFKFQHRIDLAAPLAALLAAALPADLAPAGSAGPLLVVPVPLSDGRLAARGFNQAWELARRIARTRGLPADPQALVRVLDTEAQAGLTRAQRQRNLRNAFAPAAGGALAGRDVALVDDVMTTGSTAREATAALLRGGARSVQLWVLARTPESP
ncbi:MAG: ComF family protein [Rubrivivax sp.]|nr:ComF family protein [Rubrivivax sp.]